MLQRLLCLIRGHKAEQYGEEIIVQPHESVAHMGPAIFQEMVCLRCGSHWQEWVRHPYEEAKKERRKS
jgi:hypothetical protein